MITELITHLWQTTLFAGAAWILTLALRKNPAHVRHWVWFAATAKFLLPFSALVGLGALMPQHAALPIRPAWVAAVEQIGEPLTAPPAVAAKAVVAAHGAEGNHFAAAALSLWVCGFVVISACWLVRWKRVLVLRRTATPMSTTT